MRAETQCLALNFRHIFEKSLLNRQYIILFGQSLIRSFSNYLIFFPSENAFPIRVVTL